METSLNDILLSICKEYDLSEDSIQPIKSKLSKEFYFKLKDFKNLNTKQWKEIVARQPINVIQQFHNGETQVIDKTIIMDAIQIAIERPEINVFFYRCFRQRLC